jgi:hypothetical protein
MVNLNLALLSGTKNLKAVTVTFKIPYFTHWGQQLLVCGSAPVLGSWNVKKGLLLKPFHRDDELIWSGSIPVPAGFECEYSYYVVDEERNVLRWEVGKRRKLLLPDGVQNGHLVELHDLWQVYIYISTLYSFFNYSEICLLGHYSFLMTSYCSVCKKTTHVWINFLAHNN